jgi:hypothetical protein
VGLASGAFWLLLALLAAVVGFAGPVLTSDGPAHVGMAQFMLLQGDPSAPMLNRLYELNPAWSPNALGHYLLAGLMRVVSPLTAEQILQAVCLLSVPLAARLLLRRLLPDAGWLALFFFPVALQRLFFLGLYNFCLSLTFCLLCIWAYLGLRARVSLGNALWLAVLLLVTLACQASGWMQAVLAIGTLAGAEAVLRLTARERVALVARAPAVALLSLVPSLFLFARFVGSGDNPMEYGAPPLERLLAVLRGDAFATIGRSTALVSFVLGLMLGVLVISGGVAWWRSRPADPRLVVPVCLLPLCFLLFVLIVPDRAGGGWTHAWRAEVFPFIGLALAAGVLPSPSWLRLSAAAAAVAGSMVAIIATAWLQLRAVPAAERAFDAVAAMIGPHCSVAPVLAQFKLDPANSAQLVHHPLFHLANRIALTADRPVLFNYLARLPVYPVRFRHDADPQRLLFGWQAAQSDTHVTRLDIARFEAASLMAVDYVLLSDVPESAGDIRSGALARYRLVQRSPDGRLELYRRPGPGGCADP